MTDKIQVFKMAGAWIWNCPCCPGRPGNDYRRVRDPWSVCSQDAQRHAEVYHGLQEPIETWGLTGRE